MKRIALLLLLAGVVLVASGCGEKSEPTGPTVKLFPVTVAPCCGEGSPLTLEHSPSRVAACTPVGSSLVGALEQGDGNGPKVLDVDCAGPGGADRELAAFHPDLVIAAGSSPHTRVPAYGFSPSSIRDAEQAIGNVGALLGRPLQARTMVANVESKLRDVRHRVGDLPQVTVFVDTGFYIPIPTNSLGGDMISQAGGQNIAEGAPGVGPELGLVQRKNPDYYLATSESGVSLRDLRRNPRTKNLRAVRTGHFGIVPSSELQPGPAMGDGIEVVARLLHPDAFG